MDKKMVISIADLNRMQKIIREQRKGSMNGDATTGLFDIEDTGKCLIIRNGDEYICSV